MYQKMPFVLMNTWSTFEREMDIYFTDQIYHFIFIYLDDMIVFS